MGISIWEDVFRRNILQSQIQPFRAFLPGLDNGQHQQIPHSPHHQRPFPTRESLAGQQGVLRRQNLLLQVDAQARNSCDEA